MKNSEANKTISDMDVTVHVSLSELAAVEGGVAPQHMYQEQPTDDDDPLWRYRIISRYIA